MVAEKINNKRIIFKKTDYLKTTGSVMREELYDVTGDSLNECMKIIDEFREGNEGEEESDRKTTDPSIG